MMVDWHDIGEILKKFQEQMKAKGQELPEGMVAGVTKAADDIFNPIEALDVEQVKIYNEIKSIKSELDEAVKIKDALEKKLKRFKLLTENFSSSIELKHDLMDKVWRVNEHTSMVEVFDQPRAVKQMQDMGLGDVLPPNLFDHL